MDEIAFSFIMKCLKRLRTEYGDFPTITFFSDCSGTINVPSGDPEYEINLISFNNITHLITILEERYPDLYADYIRER